MVIAYASHLGWVASMREFQSTNLFVCSDILSTGCLHDVRGMVAASRSKREKVVLIQVGRDAWKEQKDSVAVSLESLKNYWRYCSILCIPHHQVWEGILASEWAADAMNCFFWDTLARFGGQPAAIQWWWPGRVCHWADCAELDLIQQSFALDCFEIQVGIKRWNQICIYDYIHINVCSKGHKGKSQALNHCRHEATPRLLDLMDGWVDIIRNLSELVSGTRTLPGWWGTYGWYRRI